MDKIKIPGYNCTKCGLNVFYIKEKETTAKWKHIGLYCTECDKWHKWINREEQQRLEGVLKE